MGKTVQYRFESLYSPEGTEIKVIKPATFSLFRLKKSAIALPLVLLSSRDRLIVVAVICSTLLLAFLDLLGVLLIGVIGSLSLTGITTGQTGNRVIKVLEVLQIEKLDLQTQVVVVGLIAAISLVSKTLFSLFLIRKTLFFMARRAAVLSSDLVSRYFTISVSNINRRSAQTSIYALTNGVDLIMVNVFGVFVALISDCALLLVMFFGLSFVDPISAVTSATIFGSLALFLFKIMHHKMQSLGEKQGKLQIRSAERINEAVNAYRELLVRNRRGFYAQQIGDLRHELADGRATLGFMSNLSKYVLEITLVLGSLLLASYQFYTSSAFRAIATITIFVAASTRIIPAILRLQQGLLGMKSAFAEAKPTVSLIEELIHIQPEVSQVQSLTRDHYGFCPEVRATNISFSYDTNHRVLKGVDLYVGSGEFVAIVGGSGAGKTTLVDVLLGALDYDAGQIEISGTSPKLAFSSWPGAVSYVSQDCMVINGTIKENLGLGYLASEIEDAYCWESLRFARLDDFVRSLPLQLNSYVGDRGTSLSGGQRQRLGIARALITRPKLLILDEATSALDGITESEISQSLRSLSWDATLIVIAHRLSTIQNADRIYFMEAGVVKGVGTFSELKNANPDFLRQANQMGL